MSDYFGMIIPALFLVQLGILFMRFTSIAANKANKVVEPLVELVAALFVVNIFCIISLAILIFPINL